MTGAQPASAVLYLQVVARLREVALSAGEVASLTGVGERQVQRWAAGVSKPEGDSRYRLLEVSYIVDQLRDVYTDEGIEIWLHGRNRALGGRRPLELLHEGEFDVVLELIGRLAVGAE